MRALKFIVIAAVLSILIPSYAYSEDLGAMRTTLIERGVYIYTDDEGEWLEARANFPLREGDALWAAEDGRAELSIRGGTYIRMDYETLLEVLQVGRFLDSGEDIVRLFLEEGALYIDNEQSGYEYIQIESSFSSVRVPEGAVAMVDTYSDGSSRVSVLKGHVYSQSSSGSVRLDAGSSAVTGEGLYARIMPLGEPSSWEQWNRDRDKELRGVYASTRYLPDELHDYAYDFDEYGSWVYVRDYGHVWRPSLSISVSLGWAPYRHGRWYWRHGHYVWISYERWGWAPYHYGRWAYIGGIGWCWVPPARGAVYWGPGYVAWVYTSGYVGWVPLAPHEIYYGYGYYGPYSVNIIDIDIHKTVVKKVYINAKVKNAVTVVNRDKFLKWKGEVKPMKPPKGLFAKGKKGVGPPPDFRPDREGKPHVRDLDIYKKAAPGKAPPRPAVRGEARRPEPRPTPPGRGVERGKGTKPGIGPERQGPQMPSFEPSGREKRVTPPKGQGRPETTGPSMRPEPPGRGTTERSRDRVITPPKPSQPERGRERDITPPDEQRRVIPPASQGAPGRSRERVAPSRESAPSRAPERVTPSREQPPGWVETPSSRGRGRDVPPPSATPSRQGPQPSSPQGVTAPSRQGPQPSSPQGVTAPSKGGPQGPPPKPDNGSKGSSSQKQKKVTGPPSNTGPEETLGTDSGQETGPYNERGRGRYNR